MLRPNGSPPRRPPAQSAQPRSPDLEKMPIGELLTTLGVAAETGLSAAEARKRLAIFGPNALVEKRVGVLQ